MRGRRAYFQLALHASRLIKKKDKRDGETAYYSLACASMSKIYLGTRRTG